MDGVNTYLNHGNGQQTLNQRLLMQVLNYTLSRSRLSMMTSAEGDVRRNINHECGYPETTDITPEILRELYDRDAVAARIVDLFPEECWQVTPFVYEDENPAEMTAFEQALDDVVKGLRGTSWFESEDGNPLWEHMLRADRLCGVGAYGVMLLGLDDGKDLAEPADGIDERGQKSGSGTGRRLLFLREFDETLAKVNSYEADPTNPRYGQPTYYNLTFDDPKLLKETSTQANVTKTVHWSRVVHVADNLGTSDLFGVPRLQPVFNRVQDLRKLYGGSAEMYWKGAFPGMGLVTNPQLGSDVSFPTNIKDTMEEYFNGLQRYLGISGVEPKMLSPTVVDPTGQVKLHLEAICIRLAIPMRVFLGSERGELASSQDSRAWTDRLRRRQNTWITPRLVCPVIDRLICLGVLPEPTKYVVEWPDIATKTDQEKTDLALKKTQAVGAYIQGQLESVITPMAYFTNFLDFTEEEAASILEEAEVNVAEKLALDLPPIGQEFGGGGMPGENPFGQDPSKKQTMVDEQGQPLPPDEAIDAKAELDKQKLEEEPLPGIPEALQNALPPEFLKKKDEEEPAPEDELLDPTAEPEVDPLTGEAVEPEMDPVTGEPVEPEVDPVTGLPVPKKTGYDALLEEAKGVLPVRGGLLPSDHVPGLRERLLREEGMGTASFDEEGAGTGIGDEVFDEGPMPGEEMLDEGETGTATDDGGDEPTPDEPTDGLNDELLGDDDEETQNAFCATGEGGGVDPSCGKDSGSAAKGDWTNERWVSKASIKDGKEPAKEKPLKAKPPKKESSRGSTNLPKDPAKLTVRQAAAGLEKLGYKLGIKDGKHYLVSKDGKSRETDSREIKSMLYKQKPASPAKKTDKGILDKVKDELKGAPQYETAVMRMAQRLGALGKIAGKAGKEYLQKAVGKLASKIAKGARESSAGHSLAGAVKGAKKLKKDVKRVGGEYADDAKALWGALKKIGGGVKYLTGNQIVTNQELSEMERIDEMIRVLAENCGVEE